MTLGNQNAPATTEGTCPRIKSGLNPPERIRVWIDHYTKEWCVADVDDLGVYTPENDGLKYASYGTYVPEPVIKSELLLNHLAVLYRQYCETARDSLVSDENRDKYSKAAKELQELLDVLNVIDL